MLAKVVCDDISLMYNLKLEQHIDENLYVYNLFKFRYSVEFDNVDHDSDGIAWSEETDRCYLYYINDKDELVKQCEVKTTIEFEVLPWRK